VIGGVIYITVLEVLGLALDLPDTNLPGTFVQWQTPALSVPLTVVGSPTFDVQVSAPTAAPTSTLGPAGQLVLFAKLYDVGSDGIGYGIEYPVFWIDRYHPHSVRQRTAFAAKNRAEVEAFHAAALKAGGTENGAPGLRLERRLDPLRAARLLPAELVGRHADHAETALAVSLLEPFQAAVAPAAGAAAPTIAPR